MALHFCFPQAKNSFLDGPKSQETMLAVFLKTNSPIFFVLIKTVILLHALGERRYSSHSLLISALEGGEWSASRPGRALPPGKEPSVPTVQEAGWAPELVRTQRLEEKSSASVGDRTPAVQSVVRHCTD
jgi:hypothetical protein